MIPDGFVVVFRWTTSFVVHVFVHLWACADTVAYLGQWYDSWKWHSDWSHTEREQSVLQKYLIWLISWQEGVHAQTQKHTHTHHETIKYWFSCKTFLVLRVVTFTLRQKFAYNINGHKDVYISLPFWLIFLSTFTIADCLAYTHICQWLNVTRYCK